MKSACVGVLSIIELKVHGETMKNNEKHRVNLRFNGNKKVIQNI